MTITNISLLREYAILCLISISFQALLMSACNNRGVEIQHAEFDDRIVQKYLSHPVARPDLKLINILDTDYDFQIMNADEWGAYFDVIRLDFDNGRVEVAIQDSIHPIPRKYKFMQYLNQIDYANAVDSLIDVSGIWDIKDTLNKNRLIDGGDLSVILKGKNKVKLITWQDAIKNEGLEKEKVRKFYNDIWYITDELMKEDHSKYY